MKVLILASLILLACSKSKPAPERAIQEADLLIKEKFPELSSLKLKFESLDSNEDYFASFVEGAWKKPAERTYIIQVNTKFDELEIDRIALRGILAHELIHLRQYFQMSRFELLKLFWHYVVKKDAAFISNFERQTDYEVLKLGLAEELKAYRDWLYLHIPREHLETKKINYLQPWEIDEFISQASPEHP